MNMWDAIKKAVEKDACIMTEKDRVKLKPVMGSGGDCWLIPVAGGRYGDIYPSPEDAQRQDWIVVDKKEEDMSYATIRRAYELQEDPYVRILPNVKEGQVCKLGVIWDGEEEAPEESYSYRLNDTDIIDYGFEYVAREDKPHESIVKVTRVEII